MNNVSVTFGLDFGTSKTVITRAQAGSMSPLIVELNIDGMNDRIATCLLRDRASGRIFVGNKADQEHKLVQDPAARAQLEFFANFKPHIHQSATHRAAALDFLTEIRRGERLSHEFSQFSNSAIMVVGCPVSWISSGAETLLGLLNESGFPPAFVIPEPAGAAFYFLGTGLRAQDFHRDIVVFDWGAGTFDMTVLRAGRLDFEGSETWGSSVYGGRLFDDLFYQWLLEIAERQGRGEAVRQLAERQVEREYLHGAKARQIKESFSKFQSQNGPDQAWIWEFLPVIGTGKNRIDLGEFMVERIGEFEDRMRNYRASELALRWLDLARSELRPEESAFVHALRAGQPVDLHVWGTTLIEAGLQKLSVRAGATAILTGGSCNWKWFSDYVRGIRPFVGRSTAVLIDDKPELTIARGLARVYAVGSYSEGLLSEVKAAKNALIEPLKVIHAELLEKLSYSVNALMKADDKLRRELRHILTTSLKGAEIANSTKKSPKELVRGLLDRLISDEAADSIRPELEQLVGNWLQVNRSKVERDFDRFSLAAYQRVMGILKKQIHAEIGGVVEVAIEACGATGATNFEEALRRLGRDVKFEHGMIDLLYKELKKWLTNFYEIYITKNPVEEDRAIVVEQEAEAASERFFWSLPEAFRKNILAVQSAQNWSEQVVDHLIATLETLIRIARVDEAKRLGALMGPAGSDAIRH